MKGIRILFFIILLLPIYCSVEKREKILGLSHRSERSKHISGISNKDINAAILPDIPLHLSGSFILSSIFITDTNINVIRRGWNYYYKWVFSFEYQIEDDYIIINNIVFEENSSNFLFNEWDDLGDCEVDRNKIFTYRELKEKCVNTTKDIEEIITEIHKTEKLSCETDDYQTICYIQSDERNTYLKEYSSLDGIMYVLNNTKLESYSPGTDFYGYTPNRLSRFKGIKLIEVRNEGISLNIESYKYNALVYDTYTRMDYGGHSYFYTCLESKCKYICDLGNYMNNNWDLYECYEKALDFETDLDILFNKTYNNAKNYNPSNKIGIERLLKEESKKETKVSKGYYYEDVNEFNGNYRGYFVVDNTLTIIKQTSSYHQDDVQQIKLVLSLDSETKSVKLMSINDEIVDKEKSGIEPGWNNFIYDQSICSYFFPLKDKDYYKCNVNDYAFDTLVKKEYIITESESEKRLLIYNDAGNYDDNLYLLEYENSTKLNEIINRITKFTKPIPNDKCLKYNYTSDEADESVALYNNIIYSSRLYYYDGHIHIDFVFAENGNNKYYTKDLKNYFSILDGYDDQYMHSTSSFRHKYVDYHGNDYVVCSESLKNDVLTKFEQIFLKFKKEEIYDDDNVNENTGSIETVSTSNDDTSNNGVIYTLNIILFSLLFFIFI